MKIARRKHCILLCLKGEVSSKICARRQSKAVTPRRWFDIGKKCHHNKCFNISRSKLASVRSISDEHRRNNYILIPRDIATTLPPLSKVFLHASAEPHNHNITLSVLKIYSCKWCALSISCTAEALLIAISSETTALSGSG